MDKLEGGNKGRRWMESESKLVLTNRVRFPVDHEQ